MVLALALVPTAAAHAQSADDAAADAAAETTGGSELSWSIKPSDNDFGTGRSSFRYSVNPGDSFQDELTVVNYGSQTLELVSYAADGVATSSGTLGIADSAAVSEAVGSWITVDVEQLSIAAGDAATVPFTVTIPENAAPGDHLGGLVTANLGVANGQTVLESRLASQVLIRVAGEVVPSLEINDVEIVDKEISWIPFWPVDVTIRYQVTNTGNALVRPEPSTSIWLGSVGGQTIETGPDSPASNDSAIELLPGGTGTLQQRATVFPFFYHRANVELTPTTVDTIQGETVSASAGAVVIPWGTLVVIILVVVFLIWFFRNKDKRKADKELREHRRQELERLRAARAEREAREAEQAAQARQPETETDEKTE